MKILELISGTGGTFYCENCLRDSQLVRALRRRGCDVTVAPLYLPILLDQEGLEENDGVFFGGVNVFLQQWLGLFRSTPRWIDRVFDSAWMLRRAAAREGSTRPADLGAMTSSMLQGRAGRQRKEFDRFLAWITERGRPDLVHIPNALLLGVAAEIRSTLGVPVVCSLQDEHTWVDAMPPYWRDRCWNLMSEKAAQVDALVAVSHWYADYIAGRIKIPRDHIDVVPLGIELDDVEPASLNAEPPVLGYLSRIHADQGFGVLVDAFIRLKQEPEFRKLRLRATGGVTSGDKDFVRDIRRKIAHAGFSKDIEIIEVFSKTARRDFLQSLTLLSTPVLRGEAFGLFILEAGGYGVPVVQPDAGGFHEVVEMTRGGLVYDPADQDALVNTLKRVLLDETLRRDLGRAGREAVRTRFTSDAMADRMLAVFTRVATPAKAPALERATPMEASK